jgi:hypothetical protein
MALLPHDVGLCVGQLTAIDLPSSSRPEGRSVRGGRQWTTHWIATLARPELDIPAPG